MEQTGWIRFYCSLHQDETWDVFVSPSPYFARLDPDGGYRIENVPPGDYDSRSGARAVEGPCAGALGLSDLDVRADLAGPGQSRPVSGPRVSWPRA